MSDRYISLTDREAALAATGKLSALVRVIKKQPVWTGYAAGDNHYQYKGITFVNSNPIPPIEYCTGTGRIIHLSPFGAPGDVLHCREGYGLHKAARGVYGPGWIVWKADYEGHYIAAPVDRWRSPVTLPRKFIRRHYRVLTSRAMLAKDLTLDNLRTLEIWEDYEEWHGFQTVAEVPEAADCIEEMLGIIDPAKTWVFFAEVEAINA